MHEATFTPSRNGSGKGNANTLFPIVAILASGEGEGPAALYELMTRLSPSLGMAYIVIECFPRDTSGRHHSGAANLAGLLGQRTKMKVQAVTKSMPLEKDHVYVFPAGINNVEVIDRNLVFQRPTGLLRTEDGMLDLFLASLAAAAKPGAIVITLPGLPADITAGLLVVREEGGLSILQEEGNPSVISQDPSCFDLILPRLQLVSTLVLLAGLFSKFDGKNIPQNDQAALDRIYLHLLKKKDIDLSLYQQDTVAQHIYRRMAISGIDNLDIYGELLDSSDSETGRLSRELLAVLPGPLAGSPVLTLLTETILPEWLKTLGGRNVLRIWLPQCTRGENAFFLAACVLDYLWKKEREINVQIFCTGLNRSTLATARLGLVEEIALHGMPSGIKKRYFIPRANGYQATEKLRKACIFATHNVLKDPPFSHIDIILGCNVLSCLNAMARKKVLQSFQYGLTSPGFLLMSSPLPEGQYEQWFACLDDRKNVYVPKNTSAAFWLPIGSGRGAEGEREADRVLLSGYVPPGILVDEQYRIVRFYGMVEPYLITSRDRSNLQLLKVLRDEVVLEVGDLLARLEKEGQAVRMNGLWLPGQLGPQELTIEVLPIRTFDKKWRMILFGETRGFNNEEFGSDIQKSIGDAKDRKIRMLDKKLRQTRRQLQLTGETARKNEDELQATQEEMMASNEELQSLMEALEASKLELQGANIDLRTLNEDLHIRNRDLQAAVEYADSIVGSLRHPLLVLDEDFHVRTANQAFCQSFQVDPEQVRGRYLCAIGQDIFGREDFCIRLEEMAAKRIAFLDFEWKHIFPSLGERILLVQVIRMRQQTGRRLGILVILEDITDRKMMEKFKDEFIGVASHELKTPATSIQAYSQILYNELMEINDSRSAQLVTKLNRQVSRLTHLTKDLLDITKINQGQIPLDMGYFNMDELIDEVIEEVRPTTYIQINVVERQPVPTIWGDRGRIGQAFINLLSNAIKYSGGATEIEIHMTVSEDMLHFSVRDFGIGMATETLQRVFDRFYRSDDPSSHQMPGLGLGLYIASGIIRRHNGTITVKSEKGKGSTFTVMLPLAGGGQ